MIYIIIKNKSNYEVFLCKRRQKRNKRRSMGALQEDYTPLSPLSYCAANPIRFIDPMGEDLYQYNNQTGKLNFIKNDDVRDYVQIVDNKGDVILKNLIPLERSYAKGVLSYQHSPKYDKDKRYSVVKIRGDENGLEIFKFLSDNISLGPKKVEFSLAQTGIRGEKGLNFLTTSSERGQERGFITLYASQLYNKYTIRNVYHTHIEKESLSPGGNDLSQKSEVNQNRLSNKLNRIKFFIYNAFWKCEIQY